MVNLNSIYSCNLCSKKFRHRPNLSAHMKLHKGETECSLCQRKFATLQTLQNHARLHHNLFNFK